MFTFAHRVSPTPRANAAGRSQRIPPATVPQQLHASLGLFIPALLPALCIVAARAFSSIVALVFMAPIFLVVMGNQWA